MSINNLDLPEDIVRLIKTFYYDSTLKLPFFLLNIS